MLIPDFVIGAENAAPEGESPWWLPGPTLRLAHLGAMANPQFLAEIARHLRSEESAATILRLPL